MKTLFKLLFVLTLTVAVFAPTNEAQANHYPYPGNHYTGWISGYPYGYGYSNFDFYNYPFYYYAPVGFSYYSYYFRPSTYAAIVYSVKSDTGGMANGQPSAYDAFAFAKSFCVANDCSPVVWVQDGCAALAVSKKDNRIGWAYAPNRYAAQTAAMRSCKQGLVQNACEARAWVCSK